MRDLRTFLRSLRRQPLQSLVALTVMTLGLASGIAVFTCLEGLERSVPGIADAGALVQIGSAEGDFISFPDALDLKSGDASAFADVAVVQHAFPSSLRLADATYHVLGQLVSGNTFALLGVEMSLGRGLAVSDDRSEAPPAVVLSHRCWRQRFGGDAGVLGTVIRLSGHPFTVVGVTSPEFQGPLSSVRTDVWVPVAHAALINPGWLRVLENRDYPYFVAYARLRPGVGLAQARAEAATVAARLDADFPRPQSQRHLVVAPASWVRPAVRRSMLPVARLLLVASALLLLLASANVANLLAAMASQRRREIALRAALGASPRRLLRWLVTDHVLLAYLAGGLALALAGPAGSRIVSHLAPASAQAYQAPPQVTIDLEVVAFAVVLSLVLGLLAGWLPARWASQVDLVAALKGDRAGGRGAGWGMREVLVAVQTALSVVLLVVAGLAARTLYLASRIDPGFDTEHLVTATVSVYAKDNESGRRFYQDLVDRVAAEPWASAASLTPMRPLDGYEYSSRFRLDDRDEVVEIYRSAVAPGHLATLGLKLLRGRDLSIHDGADDPGVVLVNEALARRYFGGREPLGRRLWLEGGERSFEIVGVVRDAKFLDLFTPPEPLVYVSFHQLGYSKRNALLVRTAIEPAAAVAALRRLLQSYDPDMAVIDVLPYSEVRRGSLRFAYMSAEAFSVVGGLGLLLAAAGIFGVMSLAVSRQRREIAIRLAVGARRRQILALVLARAFRSVGPGLALGLAVAIVLSRLVAPDFVGDLLYGVEVTDLPSFVAALVTVVVASLVAVAIPARRATGVDPVVSLRGEP